MHSEIKVDDVFQCHFDYNDTDGRRVYRGELLTVIHLYAQAPTAQCLTDRIGTGEITFTLTLFDLNQSCAFVKVASCPVVNNNTPTTYTTPTGSTYNMTLPAGVTVDQSAFGGTEHYVPKEHAYRKCECGQIGVPYAKHSDWCPLYVKDED